MGRWSCPTCPARDTGFCGAVLGKHSDEARLREQPSWQEFRSARANENIVVRGDKPEFVHVLCDGWAFRYYPLADGRRQILRLILAGDLFSAVAVFDDNLHFSIQALTEARVSLFRRADVQEKFDVEPAVSAALIQSCIAQSRDTDQLLTVVGQRSAEERIAYLFLHIMKRVAIRSVIRGGRCPFPLRQQHVAEMVGITPVHVSRVIGLFRDRGIIDLSGGFLTVLNHAELERIGSLN